MKKSNIINVKQPTIWKIIKQNKMNYLIVELVSFVLHRDLDIG